MHDSGDWRICIKVELTEPAAERNFFRNADVHFFEMMQNFNCVRLGNRYECADPFLDDAGDGFLHLQRIPAASRNQVVRQIVFAENFLKGRDPSFCGIGIQAV